MHVSDCKRKKGESFEQFFRRVKQGWKLSGKVLQVRKVQFFEEKKRKNVRQKLKVRGTHLAQRKAYLQKIGKLPKDEVKKKY